MKFKCKKLEQKVAKLGYIKTPPDYKGKNPDNIFCEYISSKRFPRFHIIHYKGGNYYDIHFDYFVKWDNFHHVENEGRKLIKEIFRINNALYKYVNRE